MSALANDFAARAAALEERIEAERPTSWLPNDPEKGHPRLVVGELLRLEEGHTPYGPARIAVLRDGDGREWAVWLLTTVLKQEFAKLKPQIGELVGVRYEGHVAGGQGASGYEKYRVVVDRNDGAVDWGFDPDVEPAQPKAKAQCAECGRVEPEHAPGCGLDIPL